MPEAVTMPALGKNSQSPFAEAYKALRTNLDFYASSEDVRVVLFVSPEADPSREMFLRNLTSAIAAAGHTVLLADFDLRSDALEAGLGIAAGQAGVSTVLNGACDADAAIVKNALGGATGADVLPSGPLSADPAALFAHEEAAALLQSLRGRYDFVLLNAPCVADYTDAVVLSRLVDASVLLAAAGTTHMPAMQKCREKLEAVNARILGAVLTNYDPKNL